MQLLLLIALFSHFISFQSFFLENDESCALPLVFSLKTNRDRQIDWWSKFTKNQKCNLLYRHVAFKILQSVSTSTRATFFSSESLKSNQLSATAQKYRKFLLSIDTKLACVSLCAKKSFKILESIIMARRGFLAEPKNIFSVSWIISDNIVIDSKMIGLKKFYKQWIEATNWFTVDIHTASSSGLFLKLYFYDFREHLNIFMSWN